MELSTLFTACTLFVVPAWALLLFVPRWRYTGLLVQTVPVPALLCGAYVVVRIVRPELPEGAGLGSLEAFMIAVSSPWSALVTWIHILVVDLFVGAWMVRDSARLGISHGWVAPCLLVTFVAAPAGMLLYFVLRGATKRVLSVDEAVRAS